MPPPLMANILLCCSSEHILAFSRHSDSRLLSEESVERFCEQDEINMVISCLVLQLLPIVSNFKLLQLHANTLDLCNNFFP